MYNMTNIRKNWMKTLSKRKEHKLRIDNLQINLYFHVRISEYVIAHVVQFRNLKKDSRYLADITVAFRAMLIGYCSCAHIQIGDESTQNCNKALVDKAKSNKKNRLESVQVSTSNYCGEISRVSSLKACLIGSSNRFYATVDFEIAVRLAMLRKINTRLSAYIQRVHFSIVWEKYNNNFYETITRLDTPIQVPSRTVLLPSLPSIKVTFKSKF